MAWIYSLWVVAKNEEQVCSINEYFGSKKIIANDKEYSIKSYDGMITVEGISRVGITSMSDANEMTNIGFEFYKLLKKVPSFQYALAGVEVDDCVSFEALREDPEYYSKVKGFVINKELYKLMGIENKMQTFSKGYVWTPYEGEHWSEN